MILTFSHMLNTLGKIASVNERLYILLDNCDVSGLYADMDDVQNMIRKTGRNLLPVEPGIMLDCSDAIEIVKQIADRAEERDCIVQYLDASKLYADLVDLETEMRKQNKQ